MVSSSRPASVRRGARRSSPWLLLWDQAVVVEHLARVADDLGSAEVRLRQRLRVLAAELAVVVHARAGAQRRVVDLLALIVDLPFPELLERDLDVER